MLKSLCTSKLSREKTYQKLTNLVFLQTGLQKSAIPSSQSREMSALITQLKCLFFRIKTGDKFAMPNFINSLPDCQIPNGVAKKGIADIYPVGGAFHHPGGTVPQIKILIIKNENLRFSSSNKKNTYKKFEEFTLCLKAAFRFQITFHSHFRVVNGNDDRYCSVNEFVTNTPPPPFK